MLREARSIVRRISQRVTGSVVTDVRDFGVWFKRNAPWATALAIEKWLGFWGALFMTAVLGLLGIGTVEVMQWSSGVPLLAESIPEAITTVGLFAFLFTLNAGLLMFGILTVTAVRVLLWVRDAISFVWNRYTPPFDRENAEIDTVCPVPSEWQRRRSLDRAASYGLWGSIWFMGISSLLLWLEQNYPNQLYDAMTNQQIAAVGEVLDTAFWIINIEGVISVVMPDMTQLEILVFLLVFAIPGIWFLLASRNLLFFTEGVFRMHISRVQDNGIISREMVYLVLPLVYFTVTALFALGQLVSGV